MGLIWVYDLWLALCFSENANHKLCWMNLIATAIFAVVSTVLRLILILSMQLPYLYLGCYSRYYIRY